MGFLDFITGSGVDIAFEHIDGKNNMLADALSRLTSNLCYAECPEDQKEELAGQVEQVWRELSAGREAGYNITRQTEELAQQIMIRMEEPSTSSKELTTSYLCTQELEIKNWST